MADNREVRIKIRGLKKSFTDKKHNTLQVLDGLSLDVYKNEFLVILGPGQCGKTVLLNLILGLDTPDEGTIEFSGGTPAKGEIGMVFQRYALFPWKTVIQNVEACPKFHGVDKARRREEAQALIKLVGLAGFENAYPAALSGGMKQRVGIARAYATNADIMLMDEPFGALDAQTRYQMQDEILKIWQSKMTTVVFVTNNIEEAVTLGDRIVLLGNKPSVVVNEFVPHMERPRNNLSSEFLEFRNVIADKMDLALT
ncbi:MAG TPA: ABC transporter ATP-binding protein [Candidatus Scatomorpha intestinavium]|uniref:ABC transporter ATP-binding protein n=1 Tax=Candidatus Scatomorpha intestinavium TaxID=2840922 RepID=A0A9D0ZCC2_9FIRM|nr:ABC transporter ATP-binding protein [Candidatus Scatomorpha intestinavium]